MRKATLMTIAMGFAAFVMVGGTCGTATMEMLKLNMPGLMPLENGFHYEGWAIIDGAAKTTGKFNIDTNGDIVDMAGAVIANGEFDTGMDLTDATNIVISIEPDGDTDEIPSGTKFMAGEVSGHMADLDVSATQALGNDFMGAMGKYILATPTTTDTMDELSGVWFLDLSGGSPAVGLTLPTLPSGWKYEGWAVIDGTPVTSGTFTMVDVADDAAPYSGAGAGPPFPGEDFVMNAPTGMTFPTDLSGGTMVISIEPDPDDGTGPFTLKPLVGMVPNPAMDHMTYDMDNKSADFPMGSAEIK